MPIVEIACLSHLSNCTQHLSCSASSDNEGQEPAQPWKYRSYLVSLCSAAWAVHPSAGSQQAHSEAMSGAGSCGSGWEKPER